jgi:hypothetical protein
MEVPQELIDAKNALEDPLLGGGMITGRTSDSATRTIRILSTGPCRLVAEIEAVSREVWVLPTSSRSGGDYAAGIRHQPE